MNNLTIAGNVGRDAEIRRAPSGDDVAGFSVAVNEGKDRTTWFNCSLWGDRAAKLAPYITKGSKIAVSGAVSAREHSGKAYLEVRVSQVTFMTARGDGHERPSEQQGSTAQQQSYGSGQAGLDDEIPF